VTFCQCCIAVVINDSMNCACPSPYVISDFSLACIFQAHSVVTYDFCYCCAALAPLHAFTTTCLPTLQVHANNLLCPLVCRMVSTGDDDPLCIFNTISPNGEISPDHRVPIARGQLMHEFSITRSYAVFIDNAIVFTPEGMITDPLKGSPFRMDNVTPSRILLVCRDDPSKVLDFHISQPIAFLHMANSWETGVPGEPGHKVHVVICRCACAPPCTVIC
jgi:hypothetical protein